MKRELIPAILAKTLPEFQAKLKAVQRHVKTVHLDVMDGKFVSQKTFLDLARIKTARLPVSLRLHLMVADWGKFIQQAILMRAKGCVIHFEAIKDAVEMSRALKKARSARLEIGLAINPETPVSAAAGLIEKFDFVLVMGVTPGAGGQAFQRQVLAKIKQIKKLKPGLPVGVDGGVKLDNAAAIIRAGADYLVVGTGIFQTLNIPYTIGQFKKILAARR